MRVKRLAVMAGALLVAAVATIGIAVHVLVPRALMAFAESVKADTGRELGFDEVGAKLLPRPAIVLRQVRFGNAAWGSQPWLAQAGRVSVEIDVLALLSRRLHVRRVAVTDANVLLETDRDGNGNWMTDSPHTSAAVPAWFASAEFDELTLQALTASYRSGATGRTMSARLDLLELVAPSASRPVHLRAGASVGGTKVTAAGTIGALAALIADAPGYRLDLDGNIGAASVGVHGTIDKPRTLDGFNLALRAQAPDIAGLAVLIGANVPSSGPFRGAAQLTGAAAAPLFKDIDVEVGTPELVHFTARGELQGSVSAGGDYEWQSAGIDAVAEGGQLSDLARWAGKPLPALGRYRIAARAAGTLAAPALSAIDVAVGGEGMPQASLSGAIADARAVSGIDLKIAATAADWWRIEAMTATRLPPFRASAHLRDSGQGYRVDDFELKVADSTVSASLQIVRSGSRLRVSGKAESPLIDLRRTPASGNARASAAKATSPPSADYWKLADVNLDLDVARLVLPDGRQLQAGSGKIALVDGHLQASALQATFGGANVRLDGGIADPHNLSGLDLKIAVRGNELAELFQSFGKPIAPVGRYSGRAELHDSNEAPAGTAVDASAGPQGSYVFDDLELSLGRSSMRGRVLFVPGQPRLRVAAKLSGPLLDLPVLPSAQQQSGGTNPLLAADVDADVRFDRIVLPDRRVLGPVNGGVQLAAGVLELKQFSVALDGASATADGTIADPLKLAGIALTVNVEVSSGAGIAAFTGQKNLQQLPAFSASGRLTDVLDGYALAALKLAFPALTIAGDVSLTRGAERIKLQVTANSPLLDFTALGRPKPAGSVAKPVAIGARAIPDVALPLDLLRVVDADLDLRVDALKLGDAAPLGPLLVRATITDGHLKAEPVELANAAGQILQASATVNAMQTAWTLRLEGSGIELGEMLARFGQPQLVTGGSTELELELQGHGKSLRTIVGSLNGNVRLMVGPNRVNNVAVNVGKGIVMRLFSAANPFQKTDPDTEVKCIAARLPVKDGVVMSERNLAVETAKYNLVMSGTVNLRTENLDLAITPIVTSGLGLGDISTIVSLSGTLAAPSVGLTAAGAIKSAASIGTTLAIPGLGNLAGSLFRKVTADPNPCATALQ